MVTVPGAIEVQPSGMFFGIDGFWSSFKLRVGTPAQVVDVLISTLTSETWVVDGKGCTQSSPQNCNSNRGLIFNNGTSTSWKNIGNGVLWSLGAEINLGLSKDNLGAYGYDTLALVDGMTGGGVVLEHQLVAQISTTQFYVGNLGLANRTSDNQTQTSFLASLVSQSMIPSLSYSYSAGRYYETQNASLTLGGQDTSRFEPNNINFTMTQGSQRDLTVGLQDITLETSNGDTTSLLTDGMFSFIDSTLPNIWIPEKDCDKFADAFGLEFQQASLMYTINSTMHAKNLKKNPKLVFQIGTTVAGGDSVNITFPYIAFYLNFTNPGVSDPETVQYFPIRQAADVSQYVLGRTFFQEAYLSVNYEFSNFSVSQASPKSAAIAHIVPLPSSSGSSNSSSTGSNPSEPTNTGVTVVHKSGSSFPKGAIAGIVVAVIAIALGILAFVCLRRRKRSRKNSVSQAPVVTSSGPLSSPNMPEMEDENKDYFAIRPATDQHGYPSHTKNQTSTTSAERQELPSPPIGFGPPHATALAPPTAARHNNSGPIELAGGEVSAELHSRSASFGAITGTMSQGPSPSLQPSSVPQIRAGASPEPWAGDTGHTLGQAEPASPRPSLLSATSLNLAAGPARMVSHVRGRSSPLGGSVTGMSPSALGPEPAEPLEELARRGSHRSHASEGTLVNGGDSPDIGRAWSPSEGRRHDGGDSAFQSPLLGFAGERETARMRADTGGGQGEAVPYRDVVSPEPLSPP